MVCSGRKRHVMKKDVVRWYDVVKCVLQECRWWIICGVLRLVIVRICCNEER